MASEEEQVDVAVVGAGISGILQNVLFHFG